MKTRHFTSLGVAALTSIAVILCAVSVTAQTVYDWPNDEVPVLVHDDSGILFVGADKTVYRAFTWRANKGDHKQGLFLVDADQDGEPEIIGAGKPTFVLDSNSDPIWFNKKGCDQVIVTDFTLDDKLDLMCLQGREIKMYTHDGQFAYSISVGKRYSWCRAGDVNGDLKADIECKIRGQKKFTRIDGSSGEALAASTETEEISDKGHVGVEPVDKESLAGKTEYDFDMDGTKEESVKAVGNAVVVSSRSKKKALGRIELSSQPVAIVVKDLDDDKKIDIVSVTSDEIVVSSHDGKEVTKFKTNAKKYRRVPVAELKSAYANGFEDDNAASDAVKKLNDKLSKCYSKQVKRNKFAGTGQVLVEVQVDEKGKVKKVQKNHSGLADKGVVKCAKRVLKKGDYPKAKEGTGRINVILYYTFRDR